MSTLSTTGLTLLDYAKRIGPDGKVPTIIEMLSQSNDILQDIPWIEGNLPTGHRTIVRTGLPSASWRLLNQGVTASKSLTAQIDEACAILEAWSETDVEVAKLGGNASAFRLTEAYAFVESLNQEMTQTFFYGNGASNAPEEIVGLSSRYSSLSANNAQNIVNAGGTGSDNSSVWLICWGVNSVHGIFPKGSVAGLEHKNYGEETKEGSDGTLMRVFREQWIWKCGIALKDWRFAVRIANIDISDDNADLSDLMIKATHRIPSMSGMVKPVFYMNRTMMQRLDLLRKSDVTAGGGLTYENVDGKVVGHFRGIPIRKVDQLLETESAVA
jgi:hypothetical protein